MDTQLPEALTVTRVLGASRQAVWDAWTKPEQWAEWWAPETFSVPEIKTDLQVGGKIYLEMEDSTGMRYPMSGTYQTIDEPSKLVMINSPLDAEGKPLFEIEQTATFEEIDGKTTLTVTSKVLMMSADAAPFLSGMEQGLNQSLDKLAKLVVQV